MEDYEKGVEDMRKLKTMVLAMASLLSLGTSTSAEMTVMSLQERMRQSDTVVLGEVLESRNTGKETESGVERWLATCRVERYIIGPKIHDTTVEEGKAVSLIRIAFVHIPNQKPSPLKLVAGKKYLLFLKETGPNEYEMITPYHGAFEEGDQDYFIHDEQSPEYPRAVQMSFDEIVQRATPQDPASSQPAEQVAVTQPLTLTIQTAKEVYEQGEPINIEVSIKNPGNDTAKIYSPAYWGVSEITVANSQGVGMKPSSVKVERASFEPFLTIPPQSSAAHTFDNLTWFHCGGAWQFADDAELPPDTYTIYVTVINPRCVGARILSTDLAGVLTSNTITIEIKEKGR